MAENSLDEYQAHVRKEALRDRLRPSDVPAFLRGYFSNIRLTPMAAAVEVDRKSGDYVFPGLGELWDEPGTPWVSASDMEHYRIERLTWIMRHVFDAVARRGEVHRLTEHRGENRANLLRRVGLGAYA